MPPRKHTLSNPSLRDQRQKHLRICLRMIQAQIAVVVSGEAFQSAVRDHTIQQFSGYADGGLLFAAKNNMYLGLRIPESRLYGIGTVALQKCDHILFADFAGQVECPVFSGLPYGHDLPSLSFLFGEPCRVIDGIFY